MKSLFTTRLSSRFISSGLLVLQAFLGPIAVQELALLRSDRPSSYLAQAQEPGTDAARIYENVKPAIVYIEAKKSGETATGSGVIIGSDGLIVTNSHVIAGASEVIVELSNGRKLKASVLSMGRSNCLDLVLLRLPNQHNMPTVNLAAQHSMAPGQQVFAMGFPRGIKPVSITQGIISNVNLREGTVQLDAALNPGNSGGALLNGRGELIGINTRGRSDANSINFAISIDRVQAIVQASQNQLSPTIAQYVDLTSAQSTPLPLDRPAIEGRLQSNDQQVCKDGSMADIFTFKGHPKQAVILEMRSKSLQPYMILLGPDGKRINESSTGSQSMTGRLYSILLSQGTYTVIANAQKADQLGSYTLQATTPIMLRQDEIADGDPICMRDGSRCRTYDFSGKSGQSISLSVNSNDFEPYIIVQGSQGAIWQGKIQKGGEVDIKLPADDTYRLIVSPVKPQDMGSFTISIETKRSTTAQISQR